MQDQQFIFEIFLLYGYEEGMMHMPPPSTNKAAHSGCETQRKYDQI